MKNSITFSIHTLGCKVNSYESNIVVEKCLEQGFEKVEFGSNLGYLDNQYVRRD